MSSGDIKRYLTLLQAQPEPGAAEHTGWIALMSVAFDDLSLLERDAAVGWMALQNQGAPERADGSSFTTKH